MAEAKILGATVRAVLDSLVNASMALNGFARRDEALRVSDKDWCPLSLYIELTDHLEATFSATVFRSIGRSIGKVILERSMLPRGVRSLRGALSAAQVTHEQFCHPPQGAFEVVEDREGFMAVRYTCPYNCVLQEGLFVEGARRFGSLLVRVKHPVCRRDGGDHCRFEIEY